MTLVEPAVDPRVVRWMRRRGGGLRLSAAAALLLAPRLRVRWWTGVAAAVVMVAFLLWWWPTERGAIDRGGAVTPVTALTSAVPYLALTAVLALFVATARWRDRAIAGALPRRVTRVGAVGLTTVLGRPLCVAAAVAGVVHGVILLLVARSSPGIVTISFGLGIVVIGVAVGVALTVVVRRPTVALDDSSLWVDERLRTQDAVAALTPWWWIDFAMNGLLTAGRTSVVWNVYWLSLLPVAAYFLASVSPRTRRWQR